MMTEFVNRDGTVLGVNLL